MTKEAEMTKEARTNWFAVRTVPGSQKPQRLFELEKTKSKKGYRITPSLNPNISAIELALQQRGFEVWMPSESRLVRDRRHTDLWKPRRFALLVGYVFVHDPSDWARLKATEGVLGVVEDFKGKPLPIVWDDILMLRGVEAKSEGEFLQACRSARQTLRKKAKTDPRLDKLIRKLDIAGKFTVLGEGQSFAA